MADTNTRQGKRTPVTLKIKFKSETLEQFIERYAVDVSQGGIFIRTKEPLAVGTQMKFEFQLRDASPLIAGEGTVVWTRENDPSRPAIAPGMGVRFDRLADGSQTVLEKILAEKAKQAPSRSASETAPGNKSPMFTDTPTKVAPAPIQDALGLRSRSREDSEQTPLPKPMPFHSDAEDFDEKAFEEATKVRSLEELAAASAGLGLDSPGDGLLDDKQKNATTIMPPDELAMRRQAGRGDATVSDPPLEAPPEEPRPQATIDRDSAPGLPSPPAVDTSGRAPRMLDSTPPRSEPARSSQPSLDSQDPSQSGRTKLGLEPAKVATKSAAASEAAPRAVAAESSRPVAPKRPSSAPIIIAILVVVAGAIGAVWWFVLREKVAEQTATTPTNTGSGSAVVATNTGSGSAGVTTPNNTGSGSADVANTGSGSADTMVGSNAGSAVVPPPAAATVDTVISSPVKGATVEVVGTDQKGPAPLTAKLEKDKAYKARVTAPGFAALEIDVKGGEKAQAKLVLKPRIISVTTDPPGADIFVDGYNTQKLTPADVELSASQAARPRVRISVRRAGFAQGTQVVEAATFKDEGSKMTTSITVKLNKAVVRPPPETGSGTTGGDTGGSGDTGGGDSGGGSAAPSGGTPTPPAGGGSTPTPPAGGGGAGSATP